MSTPAELPAEMPAELPGAMPAELPASVPATIPTAKSPFNFPSDSEQLSSYTLSPTSTITNDHRPIAIPQLNPTATSPFLEAFAPLVLRHGIPRDAWLGFLRTLTGFLTATVSQKAISHAGDMAQHVGDVPRRFGKETMEHIKHSGRDIKESAKSGNVVGAAVRVVGATIGIPVATALRAAGAAVSLPFAALDAVGREPKTPKERARAYAAAANVKWLHRRGLHSLLLDTAELARDVLGGLSADEVLRTARRARDSSAPAQLAALAARYIADLEIRTPLTLELGAGTLWLVVTEKRNDHDDDDHEEEYPKGKEKGKERERHRGYRK
ncbi:uncharacterized protein F4812DRAFT_466376 [Daldinia caldariorum]|uniref:uncharacterized protein n=1 Tax=Daldinia caldariorum TaxID=326644 RepID=UPI002007C1B5|nr:uncharacterized protein F4812DRAFT_466376 [Daldinia caldariorum]KAI1465423.1 hypothetical protein F4812DRAFT_466376 [Daldinia caldariorum]